MRSSSWSLVAPDDDDADIMPYDGPAPEHWPERLADAEPAHTRAAPTVRQQRSSQTHWQFRRGLLSGAGMGIFLFLVLGGSMLAVENSLGSAISTLVAPPPPPPPPLLERPLPLEPPPSLLSPPLAPSSPLLSTSQAAAIRVEADTRQLCDRLHTQYAVVPGASWGLLQNEALRQRWNDLDCHLHLTPAPHPPPAPRPLPPLPPFPPLWVPPPPPDPPLDRFVQFARRNCFAGVGAKELEAGQGAACCNVRTAEECIAQCRAMPGCTAITMSTFSVGPPKGEKGDAAQQGDWYSCFRRAEVDIEVCTSFPASPCISPGISPCIFRLNLPHLCLFSPQACDRGGGYDTWIRHDLVPPPPPPSPPSPPPAPPSPPQPPQAPNILVDIINRRFVAPLQDAHPLAAGVLIHQLDGYQDPDREWAPCGEESNNWKCRDKNNRMRRFKTSASFIFGQMHQTFRSIPLFSFDSGVVLHPRKNKVLCACTPPNEQRISDLSPDPSPEPCPRTDGWDGSTDKDKPTCGDVPDEWRHHPEHPCVPGCGHPPDWCDQWDGPGCGFDGAWGTRVKPTRPEEMSNLMRRHAERGSDYWGVGDFKGYNEIVVDSETWLRRLPESVQAVFIVDCVGLRTVNGKGNLQYHAGGGLSGSCEQAQDQGRWTHARYLEAYGLRYNQFPLLKLRLDKWDAPFERIGEDEHLRAIEKEKDKRAKNQGGLCHSRFSDDLQHPMCEPWCQNARAGHCECKHPPHLSSLQPAPKITYAHPVTTVSTRRVQVQGLLHLRRALKAKRRNVGDFHQYH